MSLVIASVKALIEHQGKYLFLYEPAHHGEILDLPGGKIEYGEEPEHALLREVREETGLEVRIEKVVGVWWFYSQTHKHQVICSTYLCKLTTDSVIDLAHNPADEHISRYEWLTIKEAVEKGHILANQSLTKLLRQLEM